MDDLFSGLNEQQAAAIAVPSGPLLVLAGAGSGKTRVLTCRIAKLIQSGVRPGSILAVTFTNKAAKEMQTRVDDLLANLPSAGGGFPNPGRPAMGTFHSICVRMLREDLEQTLPEFTRNFVIFDTSDAENLIKIILRERGLDPKDLKPRAVLSHISGAKNQLLTPETYAESAEQNRFTRAVADLFPLYQKRLADHNALDFDDLLQKTVQMLEADEGVLEKYRRRWNHLLVDEYQDTNYAQYRLVRLLSDGHRNLCVVGDDHQSIYSFRGADFRNILDFEKDFPEAEVVKLEQNYRSTKAILENANTLIRHNTTGHEKNLWTSQDGGEPITVTELFDEKDEGNFIAEMAQKKNEAGTPYRDMAVLYRMNAQSRAIEEALMRHQIPYQIIGGTRFFDRAEIKDILAYLRLIFNPRDDVAFLRIINVPARKIGPATIDVLRRQAQERSISLLEACVREETLEELPAGKRAQLREFAAVVGMWQALAAEGGAVTRLIEKIIDQTDYFSWLHDGTKEGESRIQNVKELFSVAARYEDAEFPLAAFLEGVALVADIDNYGAQSDALTLMTVHSSKGLEFPVVFLPGWEEGIFPSSNAQFDRSAQEEERRLAYVAITRAMKECHITHARQRMLFGRTDYGTESSFLSQLHGDYTTHKTLSGSGIYMADDTSRRPGMVGAMPVMAQPSTRGEAIFGKAESRGDFRISDRIKHSEFGEGTVIHINGDVLTVAFSGRGVKKIVASVAPIEKVG